MAAPSTLSPPARRAVRSDVLYPRAQWWFLLAIVITWIGFSHTYFAVIRTEPLLHHVHGALMGGWIVLLIVQPILYQRRQMTLHRLLGKIGAYFWIPAVVVCGFFMIRSMFRDGALPPAVTDQLGFLDVSALILLPTFVAMAVVYRRDVQLHARYIVCTVLLLMPPALTRAFFIFPFLRFSFSFNVNLSMGLIDLIFLILIADDARKERIRLPYPFALAVITASAVAANFAHGWEWWRALIGWMTA